MTSSLIQLSGWVPAVVFPLACLVQLVKILREQSVDGVSAVAWVAFGLANISLYIYTEKYASLQTIIGMLGQAGIDFLIAFFTFYFGQKLQVKQQIK
jgi:uncharacterized protein with PQ loop repeat